MNIGFDGKEAVRDKNSLGDYSRRVIETLARGDSSRKCLLYTPDMPRDACLDRIRALHNVEFRLPASQGFHGGLWRAFGITNNLHSDGVQVFHGLCGELPLNIKEAHVPAVVSIHSLDFRKFPARFNFLKRLLLHYRTARACRDAVRIIVPDSGTGEDIVKLYNIDPHRIDVIDSALEGTALEKALLETYSNAIKAFESNKD